MLRMRKYVLMVMVTILVVSVFTGCTSKTDATGDTASTEKEVLKIGFMNTNLSNEYQVAMLEAARESATELGIELIEYDGQGDASKQITQMEQLIAQQVDAIVMAPYDKDATAPAVIKAKEANIPLIIVNSTVINMDEATAFVGSDDTISGSMAMEKMAEEIEYKGDIMMIRGPIGNSAEVGRTKGITKTLEKYPDIQIVVDEPADWDRQKAMRLVENKIQSGLDLAGIVAQNDEMALGALLAVSASGKLDTIKIIGIDAIPDALTAVENGEMIATVFQDAKAQASTALEVAVKAANGKDVESKYMVQFKLVTQENISDFK